LSTTKKFDKIKLRNSSGAPTSLARNSAAAESEDGQKFLPPNPLPFCPPERSVWRAKRAVSSVQKRFGFRQINAQTNEMSLGSGASQLLGLHKKIIEMSCGGEILLGFRRHLKYVFISLILIINYHYWAWDSSLRSE
jgi:hypothetical protein